MEFDLNHTRKLAAICLALTAAPFAAGCYVEKPLETLPPPPATRILATLTDSGTVAMSNAIGPGALAVEGVVTSANNNVWVLQMLRVDHRDGRTINWNREPVSFAPNLLSKPTVKVLDRTRSWLAAGGIAIGAFVLAQAFDLFGSPDEEGEEPPPPASVIPSGGR
ncbi:MAG TPA: hypothetical protein VGD27_15135 [Longimicrobiales bacterium]